MCKTNQTETVTLQTQYRIGIEALLTQCTTKTTQINHVTQNDRKEKLLYLFDFQKYAITHLHTTPRSKLQVKRNTKTFDVIQRKLVQPLPNSW